MYNLLCIKIHLHISWSQSMTNRDKSFRSFKIRIVVFIDLFPRLYCV